MGTYVGMHSLVKGLLDDDTDVGAVGLELVFELGDVDAQLDRQPLRSHRSANTSHLRHLRQAGLGPIRWWLDAARPPTVYLGYISAGAR
jgi:hypothetical protein